MQHSSNGASQNGDKGVSQSGKQSGKSKGKAGKGRKGKPGDSQAGASTVSSGVKLEDVRHRGPHSVCTIPMMEEWLAGHCAICFTPKHL